MTKLLTEEQYLNTMGSSMIDVTTTAKPVTDIWSYAAELVAENTFESLTVEEGLVDYVYRNNQGTVDHVLLPTAQHHVYVVIVVDLQKETIIGHYLLNLNEKYG